MCIFVSMKVKHNFLMINSYNKNEVFFSTLMNLDYTGFTNNLHDKCDKLYFVMQKLACMSSEFALRYIKYMYYLFG